MMVIINHLKMIYTILLSDVKDSRISHARRFESFYNGITNGFDQAL